MAKGRRYARDNRGRFASVGATARGGRLRTAGGNKRATVTVKAKGGGKGTMAKPKGLKPGALKPKAARVRPARPMPVVNTNNANSRGLPGRPKPRVIGAPPKPQAKTKKGRRVVQTSERRKAFVKLPDGNYAITTAMFAPDARGRRTTSTVVASPAQAKRQYKRARTWQGLNGKSPRARRVM